MKAIHHKLTDQEAMRQRLGFDPVEFMAEQRAKGLVTDTPSASSSAQPPANKKGQPKRVISVKMEVVKKETCSLTSITSNPVTKQRMKLVVEILTIAAQEYPQLLSDHDHQAALSHATNLVNKL